MTKYDDEIREVEARLAREREALVAQAEKLGASARNAVVSPKGLLAAAALGFLIGEALKTGRPAARTSTGTKLGIGGLIGSAAITLMRARYGSPWAMGRSVWQFAQAQRERRADLHVAAAAPAEVEEPRRAVRRGV